VDSYTRGIGPLPIVGGLILLLVLIVALFAPLLAPYDPLLVTGPPLAPPDASHILGTNDIGQDVLSEWLWGARSSMIVAVLVTALSTAMSWGVGMTAGLSRRAEGPLIAVADLLLALPGIPLYILAVALIGSSQWHLILVIGLLSWPSFARIVRAQVIALRTQAYVDAARACGATGLHIARRHILPGTLGLLPAKLVLTVRFAIFTEATLGFLGLGDPSARSWGTMLGWAFGYPLVFVRGAWVWWVLPPALSIMLVVLATTWLSTGTSYDGNEWDANFQNRITTIRPGRERRPNAPVSAPATPQ